MRTKEEPMDEKLYDVVILGGGPAGYTAALYCARAGFSAVVLEKLCAGGQMALTDRIENYPGFDQGIDGLTLGEQMRRGAERFGAESLQEEALHVSLAGPVKRVQTEARTLLGRCVILATGAGPRHLGLPEEAELIGRGVSYCAACDAMFYRGKTVAVVGGGNTAAGDALVLSRLCREVILIHRRDVLRADRVYRQPLLKAANVRFCWNSRVEEILHGQTVSGVRLRDLTTGQTRTLPCEGLFVAVGREPASALFRDQVELDAAGYVRADETTRTSVPGVFAVGDLRTKAVRQVVTAAADGAAAAHFVEEYLAGQV